MCTAGDVYSRSQHAPPHVDEGPPCGRAVALLPLLLELAAPPEPRALTAAELQLRTELGARAVTAPEAPPAVAGVAEDVVGGGGLLERLRRGWAPDEGVDDRAQ